METFISGKIKMKGIPRLINVTPEGTIGIVTYQIEPILDFVKEADIYLFKSNTGEESFASIDIDFTNPVPVPSMEMIEILNYIYQQEWKYIGNEN